MADWRNLLDTGDRVTATIRHPTNGGDNRISVTAIVVDNIDDKRKVNLAHDGREYVVDYNDIKAM